MILFDNCSGTTDNSEDTFVVPSAGMTQSRMTIITASIIKTVNYDPLL